MTIKIAPVQAPPKDASPQEIKDFHDKKEAARQFEAIFVRKMLASLEKTANPGATGDAGGGGPGGIYASMMVSSLADAVTQNGGVGLSDMILRALTQKKEPPK